MTLGAAQKHSKVFWDESVTWSLPSITALELHAVLKQVYKQSGKISATRLVEISWSTKQQLSSIISTTSAFDWDSHQQSELFFINSK